MRLWLILAAVNGALAVALGAYAAHGVDALSQAYEASLLEKATRYQMTHALALLGIAPLDRLSEGARAVRAAGGLFTLGILLFCGTLYVTALVGVKAGFLAPFGGTALIAGWLCLVWAAFTLSAKET